METTHQVGKDCAVSAETQSGGRELQSTTPVHSGCQRAHSGYYWLAQQLRSVSLGVTAHQATSGGDKGE